MSTQISKRPAWRLAAIVVASTLGLGTAGHAAASPTIRSEEGYTAQNKPRVTVMQFDDTNTNATSQRYGPSVSAMMVTFLKTQSQFVVVERHDLHQVLEEWKQASSGATDEVVDPSRVELLESLDVILHGKVTLIGSDRVEVDAKLLSRLDGRIITAAKHYGPLECLRQVVERLGGDLERNYLRSYYGSLEVTFKEPANTHIYLTPVLTPDAADEEKPPVELRQTIYSGIERDTVIEWVTSPTTYKIENVLSGWYTLRLSRPGYEDVGTAYSLWQARKVSGKTKVFYYCAAERKYFPAEPASADRCENPGRRDGEPHWLQFLVYVPPLRTAALDLTERAFGLSKSIGTIDLEITDTELHPLSGTRLLVRSLDLDINPRAPDVDRVPCPDAQRFGSAGSSDPEDEDDESPSNDAKVAATTQATNVADQASDKCNFLVREPIYYRNHPPRQVVAGDSFMIADFAGGELTFESYAGEQIPTGRYEVIVWAPYYEPQPFKFEVKTGAKDSTRVLMTRRRDELILRGYSDNQVTFTGLLSGYRRSFTLRAETPDVKISLPIDRFQVDADVVGLRPRVRELDLLPPSERPPDFAIFRCSDTPTDASAPLRPRELRIKDRVWVAGRLAGFQRSPNAFYDHRVAELLDEIFGDPETYEWRADDTLDPSLLSELADHLEDVDLLILNEIDMFRMRVIPELESLISGYVSDGHALMAFVAAGGAYDPLLGAHLALKKRYGKTSQLKLFPGELRNIRPQHKIELDKKRLMPKLKDAKEARREWRVVSFGKKKKRPRVIERGDAEQGGYTLVWLDSAELVVDPEADDRPGFFSRVAMVFKKQAAEAMMAALSPLDPATPPGDLPKPEEIAEPKSSAKPELQLRYSLEAIYKARLANQEILVVRSAIKNHALLWAEYLMDRRLGAGEERLREARNRLQATGVALRP